MIYILMMKIGDNEASCCAYSSIYEIQKNIEKMAKNIRGSKIKNRGLHGYDIIVNNVEVCTMDILTVDRENIEFHLLKFINDEYQETRMFSSRENAVNFVHQRLDIYNHIAANDEDTDGDWSFKDSAGTKVQYILLLAIYENINKTVKTNKYFDILGIKQNATEKEIKKAYKQKSKKYHPDMGGNMQDFLKIQEAYENIINGFGDIDREISHRELLSRFRCVNFEQELNYAQRQSGYKIISGIITFIYMTPVTFWVLSLLSIFTGNDPFKNMETIFFYAILFAAIVAIEEVTGVDVSKAIKGRPIKK